MSAEIQILNPGDLVSVANPNGPDAEAFVVGPGPLGTIEVGIPLKFRAVRRELRLLQRNAENGPQVGKLVKEFHEACQLETDARTPGEGGESELAALRVRLILEEVAEVIEALYTAGDPSELAKELADLAYVTAGTAVSYGIDHDRCIEAVHASNMSKLDEEGNPIIRDDGKILKGPNYFEPDLGFVNEEA